MTEKVAKLPSNVNNIITNQGVTPCPHVFTDNDDRISFLEILGKMSERFGVEVYAYVLMNNHYHLLLKTNKPNISKSMQWFGTTYTRRYNVKHKRNGHLFQGRFKNFLGKQRGKQRKAEGHILNIK